MKKVTGKPSDLLGLTLFLATVIHAVVILGISFSTEVSEPPRTPSLEVVMINTQSDTAPEDAKRIAQANQLASGTTDKENNPTSPVTSKSWSKTSGVAPEIQQQKSVAQSEISEKVLTTREQAAQSVFVEPETKELEPNETRDNQSLDERNLELAKLVTELAREEHEYNQRPRINFIDTQSAKSAIEASYLAGWVDKVERVGNLNYPDAARRSKLRGILILNVLINHDGNIINVTVSSKSGRQMLDDAAVRIAKLASPYAKFPKDMREQYDQLMITRSWIFEAGSHLSTR